jgi:hypothetical protein
VIDISVKADIRRATAFLRAVEKSVVPRATARALNRTATSVRAEAAREMQKKRALRIGVIKGAMFMKRASTKNLTATVGVSGQPIPIRHFARVGIRGITVTIQKGSKRRLLQRNGNKAFTNPRLGGGLSIFVREGKKRLPISKWRPVPGLPHVFVQNAVLNALRRVVDRVFPPRLEHELKYEISRQEARHR